jgi:hypothetical protein
LKENNMPIRVAAILFGLLAVCVIVILLAWAFGGEFYLFMPPSRHSCEIDRPPTHPAIVLAALLFCVALFLLYSQHWGLVFFTALFGGIVLGSIVGYLLFAWTPTLVQWLLTAAVGVETWYGWTKHGDYFDY